MNEVLVTSDNKFIVTSGEDAVINVWNSTNLDCLHTLKMASKWQSCLALTLDDKHVIGSAKSGVGVWNIDSGEAVVRFDNGCVVTCLAASSDGAYVLTGGNDGTVQVWDIIDGAKERTFLGHEGKSSFKQFFQSLAGVMKQQSFDLA